MEMAQKCSLMDLQLFAEEPAPEPAPEPAELTPDKVENMWANIGNEPEPAPEPEPKAEPTPEPNPEPESKPEPEPQKEEPKEPDYSQIVRFKENGQQVELTLAQLIEKAQKGANAERHIQEAVAKQRAFEAALQQKPPEPKPEDRLKTLQQQLDEYSMQFQRDYGMEFNQFDPSHMAAFFDDRAQKQAREIAQKQSQEAQQREWETQENRYAKAINEFAADKNFEKVNNYAIQAMFNLPQKGQDGIAEFQQLWPVYQKIQQRIAWEQNPGKVRVDPFTAQEVDAITKFYDNCKKEYYAKQFTPKPAEKKPTVKTETPGSGEQVKQAFDFDKFAHADVESQEKAYEMFYQQTKKKG